MKNYITLSALTCLVLCWGTYLPSSENTPVAVRYQPANDFTAQWITVDSCPAELPNLWLTFRKSFTLDSIPQNALCRIAVDSKYWLWLNGKPVVFEGGLKRGPSPNDTYYDELDLAPWLQQGKNTLAILVWYFGKSGFSHVNSGRAGLLFDTAINGPNGFQLPSDASWKAELYSAVPQGLKLLNIKERTFNTKELDPNWRTKTFGPYEIVTNSHQPNYRLSEWNIRFDARYDWPSDWRLSDFDDTQWHTAKTLGTPSPKPVAPWGMLYKRPLPQWKDYGLKDFPQKDEIPTVSTGNAIMLKIPYNAQVNPYLKVESPAGKKIVIRMDNYHGGGEYNVRAEYITREGVQEYESLGWMNGHVMIFEIPQGVKILALKYRETGYNTTFGDNFHCDDEFYNTLWKKAVRTLYVTMRDTYFDCPDRERAQWWGDAVNELGEAFYAMDRNVDLIPKKGLYELIRFQNKDHSLFSPIPGNYRSELPAQMLATVGTFGLGVYSFYSGDNQTGPDLYPAIKKYLDLWQFDETGLVKVRKGSWSWGDWGNDIDLRPLLNCWYYLAALEAKQLAESLKLTDDAARWQKQLDGIAASFNKTFWTGKDYRDPQYKGRSDDRTNAMAVLCGFPLPEWTPLLRQHFKAEKNASPYMEKYVLEAICRLGYAEDALARMKERFAAMVNHKDITTLWEGWGIGSEGYGGGTINHAWSGGGLTCLAQYIVGLVPTEPAFKSFAIIPQLGSLKDVRLSVVTHYGNIVVHLSQTANSFIAELEIPKGTQCSLAVPDLYQVKIAGAEPFKAVNHHYTRIPVKEGSHRFVFDRTR